MKTALHSKTRSEKGLIVESSLSPQTPQRRGRKGLSFNHIEHAECEFPPLGERARVREGSLFPIKLNSQSGLTLVEILVASTLLIVITFGLTVMFNQVQRAFRTGIKNTDVLEGGRAAFQIVTHDIEQLAASQPRLAASEGSQSTDFTNLWIELQAAILPVTNDVPGTAILRDNFLQKMFFLSYQTNNWEGIGYKILDSKNPSNINNRVLVGSLYRYSTNAPYTNGAYTPQNFFESFNTAPRDLLSNSNAHLNRIIDGVVHFRVNTYDAKGRQIVTNEMTGSFTVTNAPDGSLLVYTNLPALQPFKIAFQDKAIPAFVEIEMGILEAPTLEQMYAIPEKLPNDQARRDFLARQGGKIHMFRQQIPIRTAPR